MRPFLIASLAVLVVVGCGSSGKGTGTGAGKLPTVSITDPPPPGSEVPFSSVDQPPSSGDQPPSSTESPGQSPGDESPGGGGGDGCPACSGTYTCSQTVTAQLGAPVGGAISLGSGSSDVGSGSVTVKLEKVDGVCVAIDTSDMMPRAVVAGCDVDLGDAGLALAKVGGVLSGCTAGQDSFCISCTAL